MWILLVVVSPITIFFGGSFSHFPFRYSIPFCVSLVFRITSTFGLIVTLFLVMCSISGILRLHPLFWFVLYFYQYSHHPKFHQIHTRALLVEVIFLVSLIFIIFFLVSFILHNGCLVYCAFSKVKTSRLVWCVWSIKSVQFYFTC